MVKTGGLHMTTQTNIVNDVGTLLKLPTKVTTELTEKACLCISSAISDAKNRGDNQIVLNIGIGTLSVNLLDMQCKFIPGKALKSAIKQAMSSPRDTLELALEQAFADKLLAICEEVL
jgi:hypothetical protein